MPTTSEIHTRLSADNSNYRSVLNETVQVTEKAGKSLFKGLDLRAGMMIIAAAIGLNLKEIANQVARLIIGFSEETEKALADLVVATGKAADEQERQLAAARAKFQKDANDRIDQRSREYDLVAKYLAAERKLVEEKAAEELEQAQKQGFADDLEWVKAQDRIEAEKKIKLAQIEEVKAAEIAAAEEAARVEEARIAEKFKSMIDQWKNFTGIISTTGRGDKELSDRELQRKIENIQKDIFARQVASPGQPDFFLDPQRNNLRQTVAELNLRQSVRRDAAAFGEDAAFQRNSGLTEQRFREILQGIDTSSTGKLATAIDKLNQRLDRPLKTIDLTPATPFG